MKKNIFTATLSKVIFALTLGITMSGCTDPIFQNIKQEVKLENPTLLGEVYSFARISEKETSKVLFANGRIYEKSTTHEGHGGWTEFPKPDGHVLTIASDSADNLYAVTVFYTRNDSDGEMKVTGKKLYTCNYATKTWTEVTLPANVSIPAKGVCALMGTNSVTQSRRKAFVNINGKGYSLSGTTAIAYSAADNAKSCASYKGTVKFYPGDAACSDNTDSIIYYAQGGILRRDGDITENLSTNARSSIYGIAVMDDSVFITTAAGSALLSKTDGKEIEFSNLQATLSTLYEGRACFACDPSKNHTENIIYAGITIKGTGSNSALFTHEGLWSYYPSRGKWNIE